MDKPLISGIFLVSSCLLLACTPANHKDVQTHSPSEPLPEPIQISEMSDFCELPLDQLSELSVLVVIPHTSSAIDDSMPQQFVSTLSAFSNPG